MSAAETILKPVVLAVDLLKARPSGVSGMHGIEPGQSTMLSLITSIGHADTI